ncbi:GDSL-type esterase/lipase family protein [Morganella morganii]|uniref:tail fiber/spike domain-containing protein n=1 Tax=Morganella morganii TaxID=582 RepID=UPI00298E9BF9|nr:GDSL-type esterase/lipase family protein [Morganella morganii]MDW7790993.1 GDSL-type esterase/lipase family protein [Morganella morganii]
MATIPTQNAVPSEAPHDLKFNSGKIDEFVTSLEHEYKDRFGRSHLTIEGIKWMFDQLVERFKVDMNQAIIAAGYIPMDSFQLGAEITKRNEILRDETTGEYYRWDGDLPKSVPAGSTPESAGGVGMGAWVSVGDASLRSELTSDFGMSLVGACDSIEELKNIVPATDRQRALVNKYYSTDNYLMPRQYIWHSESSDADDGGIVIASNQSSTGRWISEESWVNFDARIFGITPSEEYDPDMQNAVSQFNKAADAAGVNGTVHFALPDGWESAHYLLNDPYQINFGRCWISADKGVTLHIPGTADREGWQPRVKGDVTISETAPGNTNTFETQRGGNDYDLKSALSSAMVSAGMSIFNKEYPVKFTEQSRPIKINNFTGNAGALYSVFSTGIAITDDAVSWSDPDAAGTASAGVELAACDGSDVEFLVSNKAKAVSGVVLVGVRSMNADGTVGVFITMRLAINSNEIKIVNGDTVVATYIMDQLPGDYLHTGKQSSVRTGIRVHGNGKKTTFLINGKPIHTHSSFSTSTHSIVCAATRDARTGIHFQFAYQRLRDFVSYAVPVSICCLGDSITKGSRATNEWPRIVQYYAEHLPGIGKIERVDNFAVSGWNSKAVLDDLVNHDFTKYSHVLIQVGTNDCQGANENDVPGAMAAYANNITAISNHIKSKNPGCVVIFGMFPKWTVNTLSGGGQPTYNSLYTPAFQSTLRWIAQANSRDVVFADDFFGENYGYKDTFTSMSPYWTNDNIHPNTKGHIALAAAFASGISRAASVPSSGAVCHMLTPANGYTLFNENSYGLLQVSKSGNNVQISGAVTGGTNTAVITTLPDFARPSSPVISTCYSNSKMVAVRIRNNGEVVAISDYTASDSLFLSVSYGV